MSGTNLPPTEVPTIMSGSDPVPVTEPAVTSETVVSPIDTPTIITPASAPPIELIEETQAPQETPEPKPESTDTPPEKTDSGEKKTEGEDGEAKKPLHTDTPTLLESEEKTEEKPKTDEKPTEGEKKPLDTVESLTYEPFTLPEGVVVDDAKVSAFQEIIGPHKLDQETAQKLVDLHAGTLSAYREHLEAEQHRVFAETRRGWVEQSMADPVLGGAGHQTALQAAARMRDLLVPEEHRAEFAAFMRDTGAGDHPAMFRLLYNAARFFDEPAAPAIPAAPTPDRGGSGKQPRERIMYDHPSSRRAAGH